MLATLIFAFVAAVIVVGILSRTSGSWGSASVQYARALRRGDGPEALRWRRPRDVAVGVMVLVVVAGAIVGVVLAR
jgi:hypothetical protein